MQFVKQLTTMEAYINGVVDLSKTRFATTPLGNLMKSEEN